MSNLKKLQSWLEGKRLSGLWITKSENVYWLTGFRGSFAVVLVQKKGRNLLITDSRYKSIAEKLCQKNGFDFFLYDRSFKDNIKKEFMGSVYGIEDSLALAQLQSLEKNFPRVNWKPYSNILEELRRAKIEAEIQKIKIAQNHVDEIFKTFFYENLKVGATEKEVGYKLQQAIEDRGKYGLSFDPIVAFGANSAIPHHHNSARKLKKNENILVDCGAVFEGYYSDMTRNFWFGDAVSTEYKNVYDRLLKIQTECVRKVNPDVKTNTFYQYAAKQLGRDTEYFLHGMGSHGVGLEIHELPHFGPKSNYKLLPNEVITIEPGLYYDGEFGIRIEDLVVVREDGPEILSKTNKELIVIK